MSAIDWLLEPVEVSRSINGAYMIVVTAISLTVLFLAWYTRDRNAMRLYLLSIPIWLFIEGFGLLTGLREYTEQVALTYFVVAVMEDPGWVTLAYMVAWRLFRRWLPGRVGPSTHPSGPPSGPPSDPPSAPSS